MSLDEDLIQKITEQVLQRIGQTSIGDSKVTKTTRESKRFPSNQPPLSSSSVIILLCGGEEELNEVFRQIEIISSRFSKVYIVMTKSAAKILDVQRVRNVSHGGIIITEYTQEFHENILPRANALYVPILSLNTAAKVSTLSADSLGTITMIFALMYGIPTVVAQNSIFCCQIEPEKIPQLMRRRINKMVEELQEMGIKVVDIRNLSGGELFSEDRTSSLPYTISSAGKELGEYTVAFQTLVNGGASRIGAEPGLPSFDQDLARYIDHTVLKADATDEEIRKLCEEARTFGFASVCVNPTNVAKAKDFLHDSPVKVCTVIGFPLGATTTTVKTIETRDAIANGAEEVDMVINVGALKSGDDELVKKDIESVVTAAKGKAVVKVILETALLTKEQIVKGSLLAKLGGADFVKTSTGFSTAGALVEDVELMRQTVGPEMGVKAAGGIRTQEAAEEMIKAGATRIGASASVTIVKGASTNTG